MTRAAFAGKARHVRKRVLRPDLALLATAVLGGALVGRSLANGQIMFAGLVAGFVLVVALGQARWLPYVACVAIVGTFAGQSALPQLGVPGSPFLSDLVLVAAFVAWFLMRGRAHVRGPRDFSAAPQVAVGLLLLGSAVGVFVAVSNGVELTDAMRHARSIVFYATFWLALMAFSDRSTRSLVFKIGAWTAVAIVLAQIAQGVLGTSTVLFLVDDPFQELITCASGACADPKAEGFPRVRPPGLVLVYATACFAAAYLLWGPKGRRVAVGLLLAVCVMGILVSQNRNMLIGFVAGLGLAGLLAARRGRLAAVIAVAMVFVSVFAAATGGSSEVRNSTILERVTSLTSLSELESSSTVTDRLRENSFALDTLAGSPIVGVGWGVPYGLNVYTFRNGEFRTVEQLFVHLQYLQVWLVAGLLGLVGLLAALVLAVVSGARWLRRADEESAWLGAGVIAAATAIAVSSLVGIYIVNPASASVLAGVFALATVLQRDLASSP